MRYFDFYYFMYIALGVGVFFVCYFFLRGKSAKFITRFLFVLLMLNFALHFFKQFFTSYRADFPNSLKKSTAENICAVSTLIFPFIFLSKNKTLKDYMFYMGVLSGVAATLLPVEAVGRLPFDIDVIRFYTCHTILWIVPLLMVIFGAHKLNYHRVWKVPFVFYGVLGIILINEVIILGTGIAPNGLESLFDPNNRNKSFICGPSKEFEKAAVILLIFVPKFLTKKPFGPGAGETFYWPILWLVIPAFIYICIAGLLMSLYWERKHMAADFRALKAKISRRGRA